MNKDELKARIKMAPKRTLNLAKKYPVVLSLVVLSVAVAVLLLVVVL